MEKYAFLNTMDIEELFALMKVTTDNELKENISLVLGKNSSKYSRLNYSSERSSCITSSLDEYYRHLIEELKISDLEFLEDLVFKGLGNNIGYQTGLGKVYETNLVYGDKNVQSFLKENGIDKLWKFINICELGYIREKSQKEALVKLSVLDYYSETAYRMRAITLKQVKVIALQNSEIKKLLHGWIRSTKNYSENSKT